MSGNDGDSTLHPYILPALHSLFSAIYCFLLPKNCTYAFFRD